MIKFISRTCHSIRNNHAGISCHLHREKIFVEDDNIRPYRWRYWKWSLFQGSITTGLWLVSLQRGHGNKYFLSRNYHSQINRPRPNPRSPCSHNTISMEPVGEEVLVFIPHIPFFWILPSRCVCINVFKRNRLPIL